MGSWRATVRTFRKRLHIVLPSLQYTTLHVELKSDRLQFVSVSPVSKYLDTKEALHEGPVVDATVQEFVERVWKWQLPNTRYENQYGSVSFVLLGQTKHVSTIDGIAIIDAGHGFDLETAAKIALITENRHIQLSYNSTRRQCYVVYHHTARTVQVVRIDELSWRGDDPHEILEHLHSREISSTHKSRGLTLGIK